MGTARLIVHSLKKSPEMKKAWLVLLLFATYVSAQDITVPDSFSKLDLTRYLEAMPVDEIDAAIDDIRRSQEFKSYKVNKSFNPGAKPHWYRIKIKAETGNEIKNLSVLSKNGLLQRMDFYLFQNGRLIKSEALGIDNREVSERFYQGVFFEFQLLPFDSLELIIMKYDEGSNIMPLMLLDEKEANLYKENTTFLWGMAVSILVVLTLYNSVIYCLNLGISGVGYFCHQLSLFLLFCAIYGFGYLFLPDEAVRLIAQNTGVFIFSTVVFGLLFIRSFLDTKSRASNLDKVIVSMLWSLPVLMSIGIFVEHDIWLLLIGVSLFLAFVLVLLVSIAIYSSGYKPARFFLIGCVSILIGSSITFLTYTNVLAPSFFNIHALVMSAMLALLLMSIALADKLKYSEKAMMLNNYIDPDTQQPNKNYFHTIFQSQLKEAVEKGQALIMVLLHVEGYHELVGVLGSVELQDRRNKQRQAILENICNIPWLLSFKTPDGNTYKQISTEVGQMLLFVKPGNNLLGKLEILKEFWKQSGLRDPYLKGLRVRMGYVAVQYPMEDKEELYRKAYTAFIEAQKQDRPYLEYQERFDAKFKDKLHILSELKAALVNDQLVIFMQPKLNLSSETIESAEVLVRWVHPIIGMIPPVKFIPLAEQSGLIHEITKVVMKKAFGWLSAHSLDISISINISSLDLNIPNLIDFIDSLQSSHSIDPTKVILELTESEELEQSDSVLKTLLLLKKKGFQISLDDFGTGYSSLIYINKLRPDELKIDRGFISDIDRSHNNQTLVKNIKSMAESLGSRVVVEGIETSQELKIVKELGCDLGQGYYWSKPLPSDDFLKLFDHQGSQA